MSHGDDLYLNQLCSEDELSKLSSYQVFLKGSMLEVNTAFVGNN